MPSAAEVAGTESLDNGLAVEALIFPAYPIGKHHVQVVHNFDKLGLAKLVVVIVPTSHVFLSSFRSSLVAAGCRPLFSPPLANEAPGTSPMGSWKHDAKVRPFPRLRKFSCHFFFMDFKLKPSLP